MDINTILRAKIFGKANTDIETLALANILGGGGEPGENLLEMTADNVVLGKYINNSGQVQSSDPNFYYSKYIPVGLLNTITLTCSVSLNYVSIMEYDSEGTFIKRTLYGGTGSSAVGNTLTHTVGATTASILWGSNPDGAKVTADILRWKWKMAAESPVNLLDWQQSNVKSSYYINSSGNEAFNSYYFYYTPYVDVTGSSKVILTCSSTVKLFGVSEYSGTNHTFVNTTFYDTPGEFIEHTCAAGTNEIRWSCNVSNLTGAWSYVNQFTWALYKG